MKFIVDELPEKPKLCPFAKMFDDKAICTLCGGGYRCEDVENCQQLLSINRLVVSHGGVYTTAVEKDK